MKKQSEVFLSGNDGLAKEIESMANTGDLSASDNNCRKD